MRTLYGYIVEKLLLEGGASGHMMHPIDYTDFTGEDLMDLVQSLFSGEIEDVTEKIDGTNIQATMNEKGEVVFIRNKGDLNSERGGMTIDDMVQKWKDKPGVAKTFVDAGEIIEKVFSKVGKSFFNPKEGVRRVLNCECVTEGVTNVIPYSSAQVDFHDVWIYRRDGNQWIHTEVTKRGLEVIEKACEGIDNAQLTPKLIFQMSKVAEGLLAQYQKDIRTLFKPLTQTIEQWKMNQFIEYVYEAPCRWIMSSEEGLKALFERWFNGNKSVNIKQLKQLYPDFVDELTALDKKGYKEIVSEVMSPLDTLFLKIGNSVMKLYGGMLNQNSDSAVRKLIDNLKVTVEDIKRDPDPDTQTKLVKQLDRLNRLGGEESINAVEGIVFRYRGRLMKLTGSFAPLNQILGLKKFE